MKTLFRRLVVVGLFFVFLLNTLAWNESGHLQIAALAYEELSDADRKAADDILTNHVKYATWKSEHAAYRADTPPAQQVSLGFYVFTRAAVWPDEIRDYDRPETHAYWHFITYPLKPKTFPYRVPLSPTNNVVFGIGRCMDIIEDEHSGAQARAKYLSFLIHLIGDIHQPMHCGSLFNDAFKGWPDGDKGGNRFMVKETSNGSTQKLHSMWDGLLGSGDDPDNIKAKAAQLRTNHPPTTLAAQLAITDIRQWGRASRTNAVVQAYKKFSHLNATNGNAVLLPQGYKDGAKVKAREYAALAGYRLAEAIRQAVRE